MIGRLESWSFMLSCSPLLAAAVLAQSVILNKIKKTEEKKPNRYQLTSRQVYEHLF